MTSEKTLRAFIKKTSNPPPAQCVVEFACNLSCAFPLHAYLGPPGENGKKTIVWNSRASWRGEKLILPCGQCHMCRLEHSRQWAIRCAHESSLHTDNCFITLTYDDENLPDGSTLVLAHFQLFMKRLRKKFSTPKPGIRFLHCGEYGEKLQRPHYHALLFNFDFPDKVFFEKESPKSKFSTSTEKFTTYTSPSLTKLWGHGLANIGSLTFESAAYVARYSLKKITNKKDRYDKKGRYWPSAKKHYHGRKPEYITMSRRPGIGKPWFDKFGSEVYPNDEVIVRGKPVFPPKAYDRYLEKSDPELFAEIKATRIKKALLKPVTERELEIRQEVKIASSRGITRSLE